MAYTAQPELVIHTQGSGCSILGGTRVEIDSLHKVSADGVLVVYTAGQIISTADARTYGVKIGKEQTAPAELSAQQLRDAAAVDVAA